MKTDELKTEAIKAAKEADTATTTEWSKVSALKAIAWAIIYLADALRYKI